jgi:pimeloyl-ACP methyl ester carboxylesterase
MTSREPLRVMAVHGVGDHHSNLDWMLDWREALAQGIGRWDPDQEVEYDFVAYDDVFEADQPDSQSLVAWLWTILGADCQRWLRRNARHGNHLERVSESLRWTAGMVVQWMSDAQLRQKARARILDRIRKFQPDVLCAHSLGSLVAYDTLARLPETSTRSLIFVTFGSQIGNRCVQNHFPGSQVAGLPIRHWYHLYNRHDDIFTARIRLVCDNFSEIDTL